MFHRKASGLRVRRVRRNTSRKPRAQNCSACIGIASASFARQDSSVITGLSVSGRESIRVRVQIKRHHKVIAAFAEQQQCAVCLVDVQSVRDFARVVVTAQKSCW